MTALNHRRNALIAAAAAIAVAAPALAMLDLKKGDPAPPLLMRTLSGDQISLEDLRGRDVVLLFGETGHEKSITAARQIAAVLSSEQLNERGIVWVAIYSRGSDPELIGHDIEGLIPRPRLVHDESRSLFGTCGVVAMPSAAVIDGRGRVVHAAAGLSPRFAEIIASALHLAAELITEEEHEQVVTGVMERPDEITVNADRHARLARRLHARHLYSLAEAEYRLALDLVADLTGARLGLGDLLIHLEQLDEAEQQFRAVLGAHPKSLEAAAGLALIHALRGGDELPIAEQLAREVAERSPSSARVHFVLGLIHEQRGEMKDAAAMFKHAATLLMQQHMPGLDAQSDHARHPPPIER